MNWICDVWKSEPVVKERQILTIPVDFEARGNSFIIAGLTSVSFVSIKASKAANTFVFICI